MHRSDSTHRRILQGHRWRNRYTLPARRPRFHLHTTGIAAGKADATTSDPIVSKHASAAVAQRGECVVWVMSLAPPRLANHDNMVRGRAKCDQVGRDRRRSRCLRRSCVGGFSVFVYRAAGFSPRGFPGADALSAAGEPLHENRLCCSDPYIYDPSRANASCFAQA